MTINRENLDPEVRAYLEALEAKNAELKTQTKRGLSLKVSAKGAVSVYGLGRFPVSLYGEQWLRLLDFAESIRAFIVENGDKLSVKAKPAA